MPTPITAGAISARGFGLISSRRALGGVTTFDPAFSGTGIVLSGGNLTMTKAAASYAISLSTTNKAEGIPGKFYAEMNPGSSSNVAAGLVGGGGTGNLNVMLGASISSDGYYANGDYIANGVVTVWPPYIAGYFVSLAVDTGARLHWFGLNGTWLNGDPATGTGGISDGATDVFLGACAQNGGSMTMNCGQKPFRGPLPAGFSQWG